MYRIILLLAMVAAIAAVLTSCGTNDIRKVQLESGQVVEAYDPTVTPNLMISDKVIIECVTEYPFNAMPTSTHFVWGFYNKQTLPLGTAMDFRNRSVVTSYTIGKVLK